MERLQIHFVEGHTLVVDLLGCSHGSCFVGVEQAVNEICLRITEGCFEEKHSVDLPFEENLDWSRVEIVIADKVEVGYIGEEDSSSF